MIQNDQRNLTDLDDLETVTLFIPQRVGGRR